MKIVSSRYHSPSLGTSEPEPNGRFRGLLLLHVVRQPGRVLELYGKDGASARYLLDHAIEQRSFSIFPWATFTINLSGCFAIGLISATLIDRHHLPAWLRIGLVMGVVGGYTTFSTFAQESLDLVDARDVVEAILYIGGSVVFGMIAVYAGRSLGRVV